MENSNINFNELWKGQAVPQITSKDVVESVKNLKKSVYRKTIITTVLLSATSIFISWIWISYDPQLFTTKLGIVLTILAMAIFGYSLNQQYPLLKKLDNADSNTEYLASLLALKKKQQFLQTTMMNLYFLMLSLGIGLYMIEPTRGMTMFWAIVAYGITALWFLFNWFYMRPKQIKRQQMKFNDIINKFEDIRTQLNKE